MRRIPGQRATIVSLAAFAAASLGAVCAGPVTVTPRPPDPALVDDSGAIDRNGFDALVAEVEAHRRLRFVRRPDVETVAADDERVPAMRARAAALAPCARPAAAPSASDASAACFVDPHLAGVICTAPPDREAMRGALRRLLDAQSYPRLAHAAPVLPGDPGVALRALLAASAAGATASGAEPEGARDILDEADTVERQEDPGAACVSLAERLLRGQADPEAAFRRPPLSTKQLASPKRYRAGERAVILSGDPPEIAGCTVADDESVGVARLLVEVLARGGPLPGRTLSAWSGDRMVRYACEDGRAPWLYAAEVADEAHAAVFAADLPRMLPDDPAGAAPVRAVGRRVAAASRDLDGSAAAWAAALVAEPLVGLPGFE